MFPIEQRVNFVTFGHEVIRYGKFSRQQTQLTLAVALMNHQISDGPVVAGNHNSLSLRGQGNELGKIGFGFGKIDDHGGLPLLFEIKES